MAALDSNKTNHYSEQPSLEAPYARTSSLIPRACLHKIWQFPTTSIPISPVQATFFWLQQLIGPLTCTCTPMVRYLSNPYKAYIRSCHSSAQNPTMAPSHSELNQSPHQSPQGPPDLASGCLSPSLAHSNLIGLIPVFRCSKYTQGLWTCCFLCLDWSSPRYSEGLLSHLLPAHDEKLSENIPVPAL